MYHKRIAYALFALMHFGLIHASRMNFTISTTWDSLPIDHVPVKLGLSKDIETDDVLLDIEAPFFNDPPAPDGEPGKPFRNLWDYEVVEAFFLGKEEKYLEVECSPHGQHLLLLLSGSGNAIKMCLPMKYESKIDGSTWHGTARIPASYFPPSVSLFNAYAIHGSGENRVYESLHPTPRNHFSKPNFHRLEFFKPIDFGKILPSNENGAFSSLWVDALRNANLPLEC